MATCIGCGQACVCAPIEPCNCGSQCGRISWSLDLERSRVVLSKCTNWDDVATRGEVRADVRVLADQLKRPITIIDPTDPIPGRVAEVVEPTTSIIPDCPPFHARDVDPAHFRNDFPDGLSPVVAHAYKAMVDAINRPLDLSETPTLPQLPPGYEFRNTRLDAQKGVLHTTISRAVHVGDPIHIGDAGMAYLPGPGRPANAYVAIVEDGEAK